MVLPLVHSIIWPGLKAKAVLLVIPPSALVPSTVRMSVDSLTIGFIIDPISFIDVTIRMVELALAVGFAIAPLTLIPGPVKPFLLALSIANAVHPLTLIKCTTVELDGSFFDSDIGLVFRGVLVRNILSKSLGLPVGRKLVTVEFCSLVLFDGLLETFLVDVLFSRVLNIVILHA